MSFRPTAKLLAAAVAFTAVPAIAQEAAPSSPPPPVEENIFDGNHVTLGVGAGYVPSYRGSDDYVISPVPLVRGKYEGIELNPRLGGVAIDVIPDPKDAKVGITLGPVGTIAFNRKNQIKDEVVKAAGKLDTAVEVGVSGGITVYRLLNPYDSLNITTDVKWDVAGAYSGMTYSPMVSYTTPLSKAILTILSVSARHVDDDYARYYYSVTPGQSARSGLPVYNAEGGWDTASVTLLTGYSLAGDMRKGGWALFGVANYSKMLNDGKDTPFTSIRGDADQWAFGAGIAYTF
ncbi:MipA/OmpV family protein [Novosphingobium sp. AP12]|uniref:MipA/OmpV family protein n=1 Tax=Novosphingobium sp. AP12 TaxID=1144305 RepID=UPI000272104A|nr:MipA/OmpV family protein [Novosphingobium sp. AP12]EJL24044.1 outer membrane protein V [Novosphingobium sp. AP12]